LEFVKANYVAAEWARTLAKNLGVKVLGIPESEGTPFQEFTSEDAIPLLENTDTPYKGESSFYYKGIVYLVSDKINLDSVFHEFAHPVIKMIALQNRPLFESLFNSLRSTPEGQELIEAVTSEYPNLEVNSDRFMEEVIVTALAHQAKLTAAEKQPFQDINTSLETQENKASTGFTKFIKDLLFNIRSFLRKIFGNKTTAGGKLKVESINANTTLQEMADIFLGKEISIEFDKVAKDYVDFKRLEREEILKLSDKIDTNEKRKVFQYVINEMHYKIGKSVRGISKFENEIRKEVRGLFVEEGQRSLLKQLQQGLTAYSTRDIKEDKDRTRKDILQDDNLRDAAQSLINTLATVDEVTNRITKVLEDLSNKEDITFQDIQRANFYKTLLTQWTQMLDTGLKSMSKSGVETTDNPFFNYVGSINGKVIKAQDNILNIQKKGTIEWITDKLSVTAENINRKYKKEIDHIKEQLEKTTSEKQKIYGQKRLEEVQAKYETFKIDKQKIQEALEGKTEDIGWFNKTFEGILSINDPILGGFGLLLKDAYLDAQKKAELSQLSFQRKIADKLQNLGYTHNNAHKFWNDYLFLDSSFDYDENGDIKERKVWALLQPVKDWRYVKRQKLDEFDNLDPIKDKELIAQKSKEFYIWDKKYFHQKYKAEVYEADTIFETEEKGYEAWLDKQRILELIKRESGSDFNETDIFESLDTINQHWREYKQLYSMNYPDGTPKIDVPEKGIFDKTKAQILIKHRNATKGFYEYVEIEGSFQKAFDEFVQDLATRGITSDTKDIKKLTEYHEQVFGEKGWVTKNTRTAYKPEWIAKRVELLNRIKEITGKLNVELSDDPDFNISEAYSYIFDIIGIYKNEDGQPIASEIGAERLAKIKLFQDKIAKAQEKLAITTGVTPDEAAELARLSNLVDKGYTLRGADQEKLEELSEKKGNLPISGTELAILKNAFSQLAQIQFKEPTDEYLDQINIQMRAIGGPEITKETANSFIDDLEPLTVMLVKAKEENKKFKEWFEKNHVKKEYFDNKEQKKKYKWERLFAYSVTRPTDPSYIKTFSVKDPTTGKEVPIKGEPSSRFHFRKVKDEYRTIPVGLTPEQRKNYVGIIIDNQGNYLPKSFEDKVINPLTGEEQEVETAPEDSPFINERYYDLKNNEREKFDLLKDVTEQTLLQQENSTRDAKLYLDLPRFAMDSYEAIARGAVQQRLTEAQKFLNHGVALVRGKGTSEENNLVGDEFEEGIGNAQIDDMREESILKYVDIDLAEEPIGKIPVHGVNKLTEDRVSKNVLYSLGRYNISLEKQKALLDIDPIAKALQDVVSNPDNAIKNMNRASRSMAEDLGITEYKKASKEKVSKREDLLNYIIDREFRGKIYSNNDGQVWLNKFTKSLMGTASFTFFALNLPSGIKNYWSMLWQNTILGIAGSVSNKEEYEGLAPNAMDSVSMIQGKARAHKASLEWSFTMMPPFNNSPHIERPLDTQLIRYFDAAKSFEDKFANDTNRSFVKDLVSLSWLYSPRKYMEMNGSLQLFFGMMYNQQVELTEGGQTRYIPYIEAWELNAEGDLTLREGVSKDWDKDGKYFTAFRNRIAETNNQLNGSFTKFDQPYAQQFFTYRLWSFMRRYFLAPFMARFSKDRYNFGIGNTYEGWYRTGIRAVVQTIFTLGSNIKFLSGDEKVAMARIVGDMALMTIVNWSLYLLFGWDDDDPDALKKLKDKYERGDISWSGLHTLRLALATRNENQAFINPLDPLDAKVFKHYLGIISTESIALGPTVVNTLKLIVDSGLTVAGHPSGSYKQDVGPWWYQKEGRSKAWNDIFKGYFGLSGKDTEPIRAVEDIFGGQYEIRR